MDRNTAGSMGAHPIRCTVCPHLCHHICTKRLQPCTEKKPHISNPIKWFQMNLTCERKAFYMCPQTTPCRCPFSTLQPHSFIFSEAFLRVFIHPAGKLKESVLTEGGHPVSELDLWLCKELKDPNRRSVDGPQRSTSPMTMYTSEWDRDEGLQQAQFLVKRWRPLIRSLWRPVSPKPQRISVLRDKAVLYQVLPGTCPAMWAQAERQTWFFLLFLLTSLRTSHSSLPSASPTPAQMTLWCHHTPSPTEGKLT